MFSPLSSSKCGPLGQNKVEMLPAVSLRMSINLPECGECVLGDGADVGMNRAVPGATAFVTPFLEGS